MASVAKWSKAPGCGSGDRGFESHRSPQLASAKKKGMTDKMLRELIAVVGMANETNRLVESFIGVM